MYTSQRTSRCLPPKQRGGQSISTALTTQHEKSQVVLLLPLPPNHSIHPNDSQKPNTYREVGPNERMPMITECELLYEDLPRSTKQRYLWKITPRRGWCLAFYLLASSCTMFFVMIWPCDSCSVVSPNGLLCRLATWCLLGLGISTQSSWKDS